MVNSPFVEGGGMRFSQRITARTARTLDHKMAEGSQNLQSGSARSNSVCSRFLFGNATGIDRIKTIAE